MYNCVYFFLEQDNIPVLKSGHQTRYIKTTDIYSQNEIGILRRLKMLPNCDKYFHVFDTIETVKIGDLTTLSDTQSLQFLKEDHNMLLRYKEQELLYLDGFLSSLSCSRKHIFLLIEFYRRLLASIHLLVSSNIIHNNIGFKSMVVNSFEFPILTNFRFSLDLSKSDKIDFCKRVYTKYMPGYIYWPPEIHLLSYILTNKLSSLSLSNVETVLRDIEKRDLEKANNLQNGADELISYFSKYVNLDLNHIIADMLRFSGTWDQYALGMCYLKLIEDLQKNIKTSNKFVVMFLELLRETVHMVPSLRPNVFTTQAKFKQIIDDTDIAEFSKLILKSLRF
jgi:hypothetical protein